MTGTLTWAIGQLSGRTRHESTLPQLFSIVALAVDAGSEACLLDIASPSAAVLPALIIIFATVMATVRWRVRTP